MRIQAAALVFLLLVPAALHADEGMWTFNNFPREKLQKEHGVAVDQAWLDHVRLSSARLAQGCSASFVSPDGLVMTNHHCVHACVEDLSTPEKDLVKAGFYAATLADEKKCPNLEVNQLVEITDVTARVRKATEGLADLKYNEAEKAEMSRVEKECATGDELRCDVVSLYRGGVYNLYKYRRYQDARLVFAPELAIAFFGGDPDNFNFPRFDLDVAFVRVWQGDKPAKMDHHLAWSAAGAQEGEVTFVSGNPGSTSRQLTVAQLEYARDVQVPERLFRLAEVRGMVTEYQNRGAEQKRHSQHLLFSVENSYKALRGRHAALLDKAFFQSLVEQEKALRAAVARDPKLKAAYGSAWDEVAKAQEVGRGLRKAYNYIEVGQGFSSDLFSHARTLVRAAEERAKPNETRFRELADSALPAVRQRLLSPAPIHDELEVLTLTYALTKLREELGADDPFVKKVLGKESPEDLAKRLIKDTKLKDASVRESYWNVGKPAVESSTDPMIALARLIDPDARAVRKRYEDEVEAPMKKNAERIARARFAQHGTSIYPDATFTPRLNYGTVKGWTEPGKTIPPFTTLAGAYERATGRPPYDLPESWLNKKDALDLTTRFNLSTTNDIIGGNSGSPMINAKGEVVGLIFDGNIHSLGGDYGFDPVKNRAVAVHSAAILHALEKIYGADRIVKELRAR